MAQNKTKETYQIRVGDQFRVQRARGNAHSLREEILTVETKNRAEEILLSVSIDGTRTLQRRTHMSKATLHRWKAEGLFTTAGTGRVLE